MGFVETRQETDPTRLLIGDTTGIPADAINRFLEAADNLPVAGKLVGSPVERIKQVLQNPSWLGLKGSKRILILERDPESVVRAVREIDCQGNPLGHITIINP